MNSSGSRRASHILDTIWYAGSAAETLMVLLALLAVTLGIAAIFPQQPSGLQEAVADRWLTSAASNYPRAGQLLLQVGIFTVLQGPWIQALLAALAFNVALRLAIQASTLAQLLRDRRNHASSDARLAISRSAPAPPTQPESAEPPGTERRPSFTIAETAGPLLAYAGTLLLLSGLFLNGIVGWRASGIALAPGASAALDRTYTPWLYLEELAGSEADPIARIGLASSEGEEPAGIGEISSGRPLRGTSLWIALQSAGTALQATARDGRGRPLLLQSLEPGLQQGDVSEEIHLLFRQTQEEQEFALPSANLSLRVVSYPSLPEKGIVTPVFLVEAYQGNDAAPVRSDLVEDQAILVLSGVTMNLTRDRYAIVDAAYLPGMIPFFLGGLVILAGVILGVWRSPRTKTDAQTGATDAPEAIAERSQDTIGSEPNHAS